MAFLVVRDLDLLSVGAAVVAAAMTVVYRGVVEGQGMGEEPALWVQVLLVAGALLALAGTPTRLRRRVPLLLAATGLLGVVGVLGILSIGLPILVAAGLTFLAALRDMAAPRAASVP